MHCDEGIDYLSIYQSNHFQEATNDCYKTVDVRRKCLTQTFKACHKLEKENLACNIIQERLENINKLVDDQLLINNYANEIESLTSDINKSHCQQWKCKLKVEDFIKDINPLQCCSVNNISEEEIAILFQEQMEHQHKNQHNQKIAVMNSSEDTKKTVNKFGFAKKNVESYSQKNHMLSNKQFTLEENLNNQCIKKNNYGLFKTARDELEAQKVKKYGSKQTTNNQQQPTFTYGGQKKSLGARRGIQSKFIPPIRTENDAGSSVLKQNDSPNWDSEEIVDERLKNIDPKMVELIRSEIMDSGASISWDDIAGLEFAKTIIKEVVVWPLLRPDIFTGLRRPPKGILLFGPPGTGKTLIGKCIASQSQSTFFSISASSLTSKWIGDGEKMVRAMFAVARCHQPAVVFIDEIDSLLSQRSDTEHESSRRIKTEFLVQLDGAATGDEDRILIIGATNRPQELDEAARRRFVKRLYIPLPEKLARLEIVKRLMNKERNDLSQLDMLEIADLAEGYSGADMKSLCAEASLGPIRSIDISIIQNILPDQVRAITMQDFRMALNRVRASVSPGDLEQYITWDRTYGAGGW